MYKFYSHVVLIAAAKVVVVVVAVVVHEVVVQSDSGSSGDYGDTSNCTSTISSKVCNSRTVVLQVLKWLLCSISFEIGV